MKKFTIIFLISALILISGCLETKREIVNTYVCPDGSLASTPDGCPIEEEKCPEPEVIEITKYVCAGGEVVDKTSECLTTTVEVTTTTPTQLNSCSDSDGGFSVTELGMVHGYRYGALYDGYDKCISSKILLEFYCNGSEAISDEYDCSLDYSACSQGACVVTTLPSTLSSTTSTAPETTAPSTSIETTTLEELGTTSTVEETTTTSSSTSTVIQAETNSCIGLGCPSGTSFVGSSGSDKYHYCDCRYAKSIKPENLVCFSDEEDAQEQGYSPCGVCKPLG